MCSAGAWQAATPAQPAQLATRLSGSGWLRRGWRSRPPSTISTKRSTLGVTIVLAAPRRGSNACRAYVQVLGGRRRRAPDRDPVGTWTSSRSVTTALTGWPGVDVSGHEARTLLGVWNPSSVRCSERPHCGGSSQVRGPVLLWGAFILLLLVLYIILR
jgi:hypothetical protein